MTTPHKNKRLEEFAEACALEIHHDYENRGGFDSWGDAIPYILKALKLALANASKATEAEKIQVPDHLLEKCCVCGSKPHRIFPVCRDHMNPKDIDATEPANDSLNQAAEKCAKETYCWLTPENEWDFEDSDYKVYCEKILAFGHGVLKECVKELNDFKNQAVTVYARIMEVAPWSESNDMDWIDELHCGLDGLIQERNQLEQKLAMTQKAAGFCEKHKPDGGARHRLSEYGSHCNEDAVIRQVEDLVKKLAAVEIATPRSDATEQEFIKVHGLSAFGVAKESRTLERETIQLKQELTNAQRERDEAISNAKYWIDEHAVENGKRGIAEHNLDIALGDKADYCELVERERDAAKSAEQAAIVKFRGLEQSVINALDTAKGNCQKTPTLYNVEEILSAAITNSK